VTASEALRSAIKAALEEGDLDLAAELLAVARKAKPRPVADLAVVRGRRDGGDGKR